LDDLLVAPGFDEVVGEQADAVFTVSDNMLIFSRPGVEEANKSRTQVDAW